MCPPGVDQTTRTPQRWTLLAPLHCQLHHLHDIDYRNTLLGSLIGGHRFNVFSLLHRPESLPQLKWEAALTSLERHGSATYSTIECLPSEILTMIFQELADSINDVVSLGLCSLNLWQHLLRCVPAKPTSGRFANTPIISTGTYLTSLPDTMYRLLPDVQEEQKECDDLREQGRHWYGPAPVRSWNWQAYSSFEDLSQTAAKNIWLDAFDAAEKDGMATRHVDTLRQSLGLVSGEMSQSSDCEWLLRNLTTKEYVKLGAETSSRNQMNVPDLNVTSAPWLTVDAALILQTRCTWEDGYGSDLEGHGPWAGHEFDIVRDDNSAAKRFEWTDATDKVISEAKEAGFVGEQVAPPKPVARLDNPVKRLLRRSVRLQRNAIQA